VSVRLQWTIVAFVAALLVTALLAIAGIHATPATGSVRAVIDAGGSTSKVVDVALIDASGQEYAGDNRGAGQSETLQQIPVGRVNVNVGVCSKPAVVQTGSTVEVRFSPTDCIR
jgi:hypothetical protein